MCIRDSTVVNHSTSTPGFEGQATYEWAGDVAGKVWGGFIYQKVEDLGITAAGEFGDESARGFDIGATVNVAGFGLTGYYYDCLLYTSSKALASPLLPVITMRKS